MRTRTLLMLMVAFVAIGCVTDVRRGGAQIAYKDPEHPLGDTSVFLAVTEQVNGLGRIRMVDGEPASCWKTGCPGCVRVLPGDHTFTIDYSVFDNGIASYLTGRTEVKAEGMRPGHVYSARYGSQGGEFAVRVVDLGAGAWSVRTSDLKGVNFSCREIEFE